MPNTLYVGLQDEDKIVAFDIDTETGALTRQAEVPASGGPSGLAISPDRRTLYVGHRTVPAISSFRIDQRTGALTLLGTVSQQHAPTFMAPDRTGTHLLCAYYQGGGAAVHRLGADGAVGAPSLAWLATATGAHAIATDRSNRFAFVPHIARLNDNVLEPPKNNPGPNVIFQFKYDAQPGSLAPNSPLRVEQTETLGPRHYCFHPSLDLVYFSNEQGCSVSAYRLDNATGTLSAGADDHDPARRVHGTQHLLADSSHTFGAVALCRQPRPQQHRRVRGRHFRTADAGRPGLDRARPERVLPRPRGPFCLCSRLGVRASGFVPHQRGDRSADAVDDICRGPAASGGARNASRHLKHAPRGYE
jgi:hypothetical protein